MKPNPTTGPLISVIIPTRNRCSYLAEAIDSILQQTLQDFELIVVDDACDDDTPALLRARAAHDKRIQFIRTQINLGCNKARNLGLSNARGRYVAFLDDDDRALPDRLKRSIDRFTRAPNIGIVSTGYRFIDANGHEQPWLAPTPAFEKFVTAGDTAFERLYCDWVWLPTSTLTIRSELLGRYRYPEIHRSDGDSIFHSQMAASGVNFSIVPDLLTYIRRDKSYMFMSRDQERLFAARRESLKYLSRWLRAQGITKFDHLHGQAWCTHLLKEAEYHGGLRGLFLVGRALTHQPQSAKARAYYRQRLSRALHSFRSRVFRAKP